jgi:hypothetical protein
MSKKKIKDCTEKQIFEAIYIKSQTSIGDDSCKYCKYYDDSCEIRCNEEYESCIDFKDIIEDVGEEEIEVEEDE